MDFSPSSAINGSLLWEGDLEELEWKEPWKERWASHRTPWDLEGPHPNIETLMMRLRQEAGLISGTVLVPGCGHGHDGAFFARQDFQTKGVDFVDDAIFAAKSLYDSVAGLSFAVADVLSGVESDTYDLIYDRAMLCALQPKNRRAYLHRMHDNLRQHGLFAGFIFQEVELSVGVKGPPFGFDESAFGELMGEFFTPITWERLKNIQSDSSIKSEWLTIWRKK